MFYICPIHTLNLEVSELAGRAVVIDRLFQFLNHLGLNMTNLYSEEVEKLLTRLDELVRWRPGDVGKYQDPHGALSRITGKANHLILGRRGSGKSRLLDEFKRAVSDDDLVISIGAEDYKELTYPDILIQILRAFSKEFVRILEDNPLILSKAWWIATFNSIRRPILSISNHNNRKRLLKEAQILEIELRDMLSESEELDAEYETTNQNSLRNYTNGRIRADADSAAGELESSRELTNSSSERKIISQRETKRIKVERKLSDFKDLLNSICEHFDAVIFLTVDDFYFIRREDQPVVIDYMHRICKDTKAYLKVATIKHRSTLYGKDGVLRGVVKGHEIQTIPLELPLGTFDSVSKFLESIWVEICGEVGVNNPMEIFKGDGFTQAVLASGGVPRDFFGVIKEAINISRERKEEAVGKFRINEASRQYTDDTKYPEIDVDAPDESGAHELLLYDIARFSRDSKKKNCFHVDLNRLAKEPDVHQLIDALVDSRLLHLITDNTSNSRKEGRYAAYLLDVGLYGHPPRRGENAIDEVAFWERDEAGRLRHLARSPVYPIRSIDELKENAQKVYNEDVSIKEAVLKNDILDEKQPDRKRQLDLLFPVILDD